MENTRPPRHLHPSPLARLQLTNTYIFHLTQTIYRPRYYRAYAVKNIHWDQRYATVTIVQTNLYLQNNFEES